MKIKINKSPIFAIIVFALALEMRFATIFGIAYLKTYANMSLIVVIISVFLFVNSIVNNGIYNTLKPYRSYTNLFILILGLSILIIIIYSYNKYGQSFRNYFSCFRSFMYFLMVPSLIFVFTKQNGYEYFIKVLIVFTIFYMALCFINSFNLTFRGYLIWRELKFGTRNDRLRCQAPFSLIIVLPYAFNRIFQEKLKKEKAKWIGLFLLFTSFLFYICMTRMYNTAFYAFLALSTIVIPKNPNIRRTFLIIYSIAFIILVATGQMSNIVDYFRMKDENLNDSAELRLNSINYFKSYADANPLFSMGYVSPTNRYFASIYFGRNRSYFYDDIGIINIYLHYGIIGSIPFVLYVLRIIYLVIKIFFINKSPNKSYFLGMLLFAGITQVSLSIFDGQRIMSAIVLWALCEYEAYQTSPRSKNDKPRRISIRRNNENHTIQLRLDKSRR